MLKMAIGVVVTAALLPISLILILLGAWAFALAGGHKLDWDECD